MLLSDKASFIFLAISWLLIVFLSFQTSETLGWRMLIWVPIVTLVIAVPGAYLSYRLEMSRHRKIQEKEKQNESVPGDPT